MKSFREYAEKNPNAEEKTATAEELTRKIASAYNGKSNAEMMRSILVEAEKSKRAGTLSDEDIEAFYRNFAPMLGEAQRKQLRIVVDRLKAL